MKLKRTLALLLVLCMACSVLGVTAFAAEAEDGYYTFLAIGADKEKDDWAYSWAGSGETEGITATTAYVKEGETVTIGLEFAAPLANTWYLSPVLVASDVTELDVTLVSVKIDGAEVAVMPTEEAWWYENTGDYATEEAIRLAGGFNTWAAERSGIECPVGCTKIEYTYTLNSITFGGGEAGAGEAVESTESYPATILIGADAAAENDWAINYDGTAEVEGITAVNGEFKSGVETTLSLTFAEPVFNVWYLSPFMSIADPATLDASTTFDVKMYIDGLEVALELEGKDNWWEEGTGIRTAGGYNEWSEDHTYLAEPAGFTEVKYVITPHIYLNMGAVEPEVDFDTTATYHAYLGIQTPTWIFRNSWDDANYGKDNAEAFATMGHISEETNEWEALGGTFIDAELAGDGVYTVSMSGFDFTGQLGTAGLFNLLFVSTDLPVTDKVVISDVKLTMDGKEITTAESAFLDPDSAEYQKVLLANIWNAGVPSLPYYAAPTESIEISFTVTGFGYDKAADVEPTATEAAETAPVTEPAAAETSGSSSAALVVVAVIVLIAAAAAGVIVAKKKK